MLNTGIVLYKSISSGFCDDLSSVPVNKASVERDLDKQSSVVGVSWKVMREITGVCPVIVVLRDNPLYYWLFWSWDLSCTG